MNEYTMSPTELSTRKQWLYILMLNPVLTCASHFFQQPQASLYLVLGLGLFAIGFNFLFYHCAYRKAGTKMLMFFMATVPVSCAMTIGFFISGKTPLPNGIGAWIFLFVSTGMSAWWYLLHWKMRAINKKRSQPQALQM